MTKAGLGLRQRRDGSFALQHSQNLTNLFFFLLFLLASNIVLMSDKAVLVDFGLSVQMTEDIYIPRDLRGTEVREERERKKEPVNKRSLCLFSCLAPSVCFRGRILNESQPRCPQGLQNRTFRSCVCWLQRGKKMSDLLTEPSLAFLAFSSIPSAAAITTSLTHMHPGPALASVFLESPSSKV